MPESFISALQFWSRGDLPFQKVIRPSTNPAAYPLPSSKASKLEELLVSALSFRTRSYPHKTHEYPGEKPRVGRCNLFWRWSLFWGTCDGMRSFSGYVILWNLFLFSNVSKPQMRPNEEDHQLQVVANNTRKATNNERPIPIVAACPWCWHPSSTQKMDKNNNDTKKNGKNSASKGKHQILKVSHVSSVPGVFSSMLLMWSAPALGQKTSLDHLILRHQEEVEVCSLKATNVWCVCVLPQKSEPAKHL